MENKIILDREEVKAIMDDCKKQVKYWEGQYRDAIDDFYKKSYKRQVDMWLDRFCVYRNIYEKGASDDEK